MVDQYPIGQTGVDRSPTAKKVSHMALVLTLGRKRAAEKRVDLSMICKDGHGVDVHDIHHDPLVETRILGTQGDAEAKRP